MIRRFMVTALAVLAASPVSAQDLRSSMKAAVTEAAAQQEPQPSRSGRIHPGLLWTGIGLLGAGGLYLGLGAAEDSSSQTCEYSASLDETCVSNRKVLLTTGGVMAGAGGALLAIGVVKARHAPSVTFRPGGIDVLQSVPLHLGLKH